MQLKRQKLRRFFGKAGVIAARAFLILYTASLIALGAADHLIPDEITVFRDREKLVQASAGAQTSEKVTAKLFGVLPVKEVNLDVVTDTKLIPCGGIFGVKFFTKGVIIINLADIETKDGLESPAKNAGLRMGDIITSVNSEEINTVEALAQSVEDSKGEI